MSPKPWLALPLVRTCDRVRPMVRSWFTPLFPGTTGRVFTIFAPLALVFALAWVLSPVPAPAQDAAPEDGGGMRVEDLAEEKSGGQAMEKPADPLWQVTRPADMTIIPLDATLLYDKKNEEAEPSPAAKPTTKPALKPAPKPEPKPEPAVTTAKPAAKPAAKPEAKPAATGPGRAGPITAVMDGTTLVITIPTSRPPGKMESQTVFGPKRLALDLPGSWDQQGKGNVIRLNNDLIKHVVVGEHPDKLRLVVHFTAENDTREAKPQFESTDTGVTVRIPLD